MLMARGAGAGVRQALSRAIATAAAKHGEERMDGVIDNETGRGVESCGAWVAKYPLS
jgi:hypothetical protein